MTLRFAGRLLEDRAVPYRILRPIGDYAARQLYAAREGAELYLEQHFNAADRPGANYASGLYLRGDSRSAALALEYASHVSQTCPVAMTSARALPLSKGDRGWGNLRRLTCPAALLEPGFVSNEAFCRWATSPEGVETLALAIVHVVRGALPAGGVVALSVGHLGKTSEPGDRGARTVLGGWEGDAAHAVVDRAEELLVQLGAPLDLGR